ncbi:isoprenylcysteine carboxylmethyltransferase family protein [Mycolicibacterium septicum DSM 44393]|uniref:Isoprenylcysteine carboxylmethyltransferase family protein n=1 Tax=Mycolicibacterium septicum DSM 44393 TaxID=1341646 RepID=A0A7X6RW02_9MYCO|nr:isoprenylcysteine carboxylmethyltransferase family protein [Mycolicibacterium septicum]NKZ11527.1 isoprenylcysteine carboxylmethyltransferase family protein [Mycolicibacterium septicum DSM 44393]
MSTNLRVAIQSVLGLVALGALLFVPAGTFNYWQAWVFLAVYSVMAILSTVYLLRKDKAVVERRMRVGQKAESRPVQKAVLVVITVLSIGLPVFCGLDHRFGWSPVPTTVSWLGNAMFAIGLVITIFTIVQNSYASANITVESEQTLVSTGLYGLVRHPMYMGALLMVAGMPLALGSWWGLAVLVPVLVIYAFRIQDEEKLLRQQLAGYREYMQKVHYRLVPLVW